MFDFIRRIFKKDRLDIALLVDGPNILRKAFNVDLSIVKKEVQKYGNIRVSKIYLDQYASDKLIEATINQGFDIEITTGDVDVTMAIEAMEFVMNKDIDVIALMTRDTDYRPVLVKAKAYGKSTMILATDVAFSAALKNTADHIVIFHERNRIEHLRNQ